MYREYPPCPCNSSNSFKPILLKLYMCVLGWSEDTHMFYFRILKYFCHLFGIFNLYLFRVLILPKYIESIYLFFLEEKRRDTVYDFPWCVMRVTWYGISRRYLVFMLIFDLEKCRNAKCNPFSPERLGT